MTQFFSFPFLDCIFSTIKTYRSHCRSEAIARRCSVKQVFLEISQNSKENTCARVSLLMKLQELMLKKRNHFFIKKALLIMQKISNVKLIFSDATKEIWKLYHLCTNCNFFQNSIDKDFRKH